MNKHAMTVKISNSKKANNTEKLNVHVLIVVMVSEVYEKLRKIKVQAISRGLSTSECFTRKEIVKKQT